MKQPNLIRADVNRGANNRERMRLYTVSPEGGDTCVGTFDDVLAAWAAIDAIDLGMRPE